MELRPYVMRTGLPHFLPRAQAGQPLKVVYLGGSITLADGGYRDQSLAWMREHFDNDRLVGFNAGIGGTPSEYGAFRMDRDVLPHKPDLLFVEFAVNDCKTPPRKIIRAMEGIVRQAWRANPDMDICFLYGMNAGMMADALEGKTPPSILAMEKVAEYYKIPVITKSYAVLKEIRDGRMVVRGEGMEDSAGRTVFSHDGTHPLVETGHAFYRDAIAEAMKAMQAAPASERPTLPQPLDPLNLENATIVPVTEGMLTGEWTNLDASTDPLGKRFGGTMSPLYRGAPGDTLRFRFEGRAVGFCDLMGPDTGAIDVDIRGARKVPQPRFDAYCTYHRLSNAVVAPDLPERAYDVVGTVSDQVIDKAAVLARRGETIDDPADYSGHYWYVGGIMIDGRLINESGEPLPQTITPQRKEVP